MSESNILENGKSDSYLMVTWRDILEGIRNHRLWGFLGWQDIRQRYRRSLLGPLWLTLSTGLMLTMMSFLYGGILKMSIDIYAPYLVAGTIIWNLISSLLNECCNSLIESSNIIKQVRLPISIHVIKVVWRNYIIFFHNAIIIVLVWAYFDRNFNFYELLSIVISLVVIAANGLLIGLILGPICARYRDISQIVTNIIQITYFITPIMWMPSVIADRGFARWILLFNPLFHFIEIFRAPLLGLPTPHESWIIVFAITIFNVIACIFFLGRFRNRIPYWL